MKSYNHANHDHMMLHVPFLKRCFAVSHLIMPEVHVIVAEINLTQVHTWICSAQAELSSPFCSRTEGTSCVVKICTRPKSPTPLDMLICLKWIVQNMINRTQTDSNLIEIRLQMLWCTGAVILWFTRTFHQARHDWSSPTLNDTPSAQRSKEMACGFCGYGSAAWYPKARGTWMLISLRWSNRYWPWPIPIPFDGSIPSPTLLTSFDWLVTLTRLITQYSPLIQWIPLLSGV